MPHILIVDDDQNQLAILTDILKRKGITPVSVQTGAAALAQNEALHIDVALIDLRLEDMSGLDVLRGIKTHSPETECILLTGFASQTSAIQAVQLGAYGYFQKPVDIEQILLSIQRALEKHEAEDALKKSEASLQAVLQSTADGILAVGSENEVLYANERFKEIWRIPQAVMDSKNDSVLLQHILDQLSDPPSFIEKVDELYKSKEESFDTLYFKDERVFERQSRSLMHGTELRGRVWSFRDITKRKQVEDALIASEAELRALFASMQDAVLVIDLEGVYRKIAPTNPALLVSPPQNLLGKNLLDVFSVEQTQRLVDTMRQVLKTQETAITEYELNIEGRPVWFSVSISPMDKDSTLWVAHDITRRKQNEEALHHSTDWLETLAVLAQEVSATLDLHSIYTITHHHLENLLDCPNFAISLFDHQAQSLRLTYVSTDGEQPDISQIPALKIDLQQPTGGRCQAIASQKPVIVDDMASKTRTVAKTRIGNDLISDSAIYTPMIVDGQVLGLLELQSYRAKAYQAEDGKWLSMAANQIGLSIQNARLFDGTLRRVKDLEAINHISVVLRTITKQDQMLAIVLEETLKALDAEDGAIELWDKSTNSLKKAMARGWPTEVTEPPYTTGEGIAGRVFTSGENYISRDFANDPVTRAVSRSQLPPNWGGICVPIRSAEHTLGTLLIAIPSERELNKDEIRLLNTLAEMTGASLQRMRLYEEAIHRMQDLQALREVDQAITSNFDLRPTLDTVITHVIAQLGVEAADILLLRPHLQLLEYAAGQGFRTPLGIGASVRMGDSLAGRVALERHTLHISNLEGAQANADFAAFWKSEGFASYFCVPLLAKGEVKGVLEIYQRNSQPPDPEWINYLETLAGQAAIAIDITQLFDKLQRANLELGVAYETTIESWSRALSLRDSETEGHTQRVTEMITILAQSFNYHGEALQHIRRGAILHDIGKMGVPDQILLKPGPLTDEEWVIMRKHPQLAYDMLKPIAYLHNSLDIPYYHHEKWDGTGYPHKLAGDNIPLAARIFAIVDVYDALTSDRPYRKAWSKEKAVDYIREQNGKHFDPQVVEAFLREFGK